MYRESQPPELVVTAFANFVVAVRVADGKEVWRADVGGHFARLHVTSDRVVALGERLTIFELATGRQIGRVPVHGGTLLVVGNLAFVSASGELSCVDLADAKVRWKNDIPGTGYGAAALAVPGRAVQGDLG